MEEPGWETLHDDDARKSLVKARERIDELDKVMSLLMAERLKLAKQLGAVKDNLSIPVHDPNRELEVLEHVSRSADDHEIAEAVTAIWQAVMAESRKLQGAQGRSLKSDGACAESGKPKPAPERARGSAPLYFPRVLVVGLGLIGGTLARQIKKHLPQTTVMGADSPDIIERAVAESAIDAGAQDLAAAVSTASLVILAATPAENLKLLETIAPHLKRRQLVIDVTSTKGQICSLAENLNLKGADFIGGHPLFGSEKTGFSHSAEIEADGKVVCLVPTKNSSEIVLRRLCRWLSALKFQVTVTDATTHDATLARLSHLVQLLAVVLGAEVADGLSDAQLKEALCLSGTSFRQIARLMASPSGLWSEIVSQNRSEILPALACMLAKMDTLRSALESGNDTTLEEFFTLARRIPPNLT